MSRVKIETFTGREEDYEANCDLRSKIIDTQRLPMDDLSKIQAYYDAHTKIPSAWKALWTDIDSKYNRVVMFFGCDFTTLDEQNREQQWQAVTAFVHDNSVVGLLLISSNSLLDQLWREHHPKNFEVRHLLEVDADIPPLIKFSTLESYLQASGVDIQAECLQGRPVAGLDDGASYCLVESDIEMLAATIEATVYIPNLWTLRSGQIQFFSGQRSEYEPNTRPWQPLFMKNQGDFCAVNDYYRTQPLRPRSWHQLWTELYKPGHFLSSNNYDRVVMLRSCDFVMVDASGAESTWQSAAVFMRGDNLLNILMVKSILLAFGLYGLHNPRSFEFAYSHLRGDRVKPLSQYRDGKLGNQPIEIKGLVAQETDIYQARVQLGNPASVNAFGVRLKHFLKDALS